MTTSSLHNSHIISDGPGDGSLNNFQAPVGGPPVVLMRPMVCPAALISRSVVKVRRERDALSRAMPLAEMAASVAPNGMPASNRSARS
jgi:hypothetical protein